MISFIWILAFVYRIEVIIAQSYDSVTNLRSTLLASSYNPDMLPLTEQSDTLNINLTTFVFMISEVDQVQGAITMGVMVMQAWYDEKLTWNPVDHNGTTSISIKSEDVWTPPLTVANPVKFTMLDQSWMQAMIQNDGKITYTVGGVISFTCSFNMKFWPYDKQVCSLHFFVYGYSAAQISLAVPGTVVDTEYYSKNGEWYLDENSFQYRVERFFGASVIKYSFKIQRLPLFYLIAIILPVNGIGALTCLVFLLPSESGERVSFSITVMLSLAVFLTVAAQDLPKNSEPVPIMCLFILFNMVVCIFALVLVIMNLMLFHRSDSVPVGSFYKKIVRLSRCRRRKNHVEHESNQSTTDLRDSSVPNTKQKRNLSDRKICVSPLTSDEVIDIGEELTWKEVSEAIDNLLFCSMVLLTFVPSIMILIYVCTASDYNEQ